jgi:hypothetical protein
MGEPAKPGPVVTGRWKVSDGPTLHETTSNHLECRKKFNILIKPCRNANRVLEVNAVDGLLKRGMLVGKNAVHCVAEYGWFLQYFAKRQHIGVNIIGRKPE